MEIARIFTFICFGLWVIGIFTMMVVSIFKPEGVNRTNKMSYKHPFDLIMILTAMSWISMWCFRTMY
jgi:hypothetical protein